MKGAFSLTSASTLFLLGLCLAGCDTKAPPNVGDLVKQDSPTEAKPSQAADSPKAPTPPKTDLDRDKIPDSLKTDAYAFYGLGNREPLDMEFTDKSDQLVYTGAVSFRLTQADKDGATFVQDTTGGLHDFLGEVQVALKPDGVYEVSSDKEHLDRPMLDLATGVTKGKKWEVDSSVTKDSTKVRQTLTFQGKGMQPVTIAGKTYSALYVAGSGKFEVGSSPMNVVLKEWFVKDIGMVKTEIVRTMKGKPPVTIDMVWKPSKSKAKP